MELTANEKAVILNYLKDGQREIAVQYVSRTFHIGHYDSQKLVESVECEFSHELKGVFGKTSKGCSGCLTTILRIISIALLLIGAGFFALGYYFIDLFGEQWNSREIPVVVTDLEYIYSDSSYAHAIIKFEIDGASRVDTSLMDYNTQYTHIGDSIKMHANDLGLPLDASTLSRMERQQKFIYSIALSSVVAAIIFWMVTLVFKVQPASTEGGRYTK